MEPSMLPVMMLVLRENPRAVEYQVTGLAKLPHEPKEVQRRNPPNSPRIDLDSVNVLDRIQSLAKYRFAQRFAGAMGFWAVPRSD